ncbi:putative signal peptidase complex subunit 2 [Nymphaea thermarum]|nr:putative signal peptidase complex subunit 2 [Nymphaea thermarum]
MASRPSPSKTPKKANLNDPHAIKHILDETVTEIVTSQGYAEDVRLSNIKLLIGVIIIAIALAAQFYPKKFPANRDFLIVCIILYPFCGSCCHFTIFLFVVLDSGKYVIFNGLLQLIIYTKEKNAILFTYPPAGSFNSTGLVVSSKLPRFSDTYTLTVASSDPKSVSAHASVQLTKSVVEWFTRDGVLVEGYFWKDVVDLINDYASNGRKTK